MVKDSNPHHLVLGELKDFLTGSVLADTLDERYRQKIARKLVLDGKFEKNNIKANVSLEVNAGQRQGFLKIDFLVGQENKIVLLIKYAPGSIVTRRLSTLALSRIVKSYQIPIIVVTNGEEAEIINGDSGKVIAEGLENLPDKNFIQKNIKTFLFHPVTSKMFDQASRIVYACEIDGACPCDSDICVID